jgi:hypothetical protein
MHRKLRIPTGAALAALVISLWQPARSAEAPTGLVDIGPLAPPTGGGQFIEVNVRGNLLAMAARVVAHEEPDLAELIRGIQAVRVNVVGLDDANRAAIKKQIEDLRQKLSTTAGWERVVNVREPGEDVTVFLKLRGEEAVEGVVVTVLDGDREAIVVNVAGELRPDKLAEIGEKLGLHPLKEAGLKLHGGSGK